MQLFQFIGATVGSFLMIAIVSLVWPLVTVSPMPPIIETVRDIVVKTPAGQDASAVLGVTEPTTVTPVNVPEFVAQKAKDALSVTENAVKQSVTTAVIAQVVTKFNELPDDQKQIVRSSICVVPTPTEETTQ